VQISGKFLVSRSRAIKSPDFVALCLRPSATTPTPHRALLKTKAKVQFNRAVTERLKPFFSVFQRFNRARLSACFLVFTVRSAEGRNA
jgi:hypothetical protein